MKTKKKPVFKNSILMAAPTAQNSPEKKIRNVALGTTSVLWFDPSPIKDLTLLDVH